MKFTRFLIAGALVALMAACSQGGSGESQKAPEAAAPKPAMQEPAKAPAEASTAAMAPASTAPTPASTAAMKPAAASTSSK